MAGDIPIGRLLLAMSQKQIFHQFDIVFRRKLASAVGRGLVGEGRVIEDFARRLGQEQFGNLADAEAEFEPIATMMRAALLESYDATVEARKVVPSYRQQGGRLSGGVLRRALADPSMAVATGHGISYINKPLLDAEAAHWRRLNYGAGARGGTAANAPPLPVALAGRVLFYVGTRGQPRPAFKLPPGVFITPEGSIVPHGRNAAGGLLALPPTVDEFYPTGTGQWIGTQGIQGRHYIDAGFKVLAAEFGPALNRLYRKWVAVAESKTPAPSTTVRA